MSSILDAQRRNNQDAVALVAATSSKPLLTALLASVITLVIVGGFFGWWQWQQSQHVEAQQPMVKQPVSQVKMTAPEPKPAKLDFELRPLPKFDQLEVVDLLALRQQQFEDLLAQAPSSAAVQSDAPQPQAPAAPAKNTPLDNSPVVNPGAQNQPNLEQRFAAAVQATETLSWEEQNDVTRYDDAPLIGALEPSIQALVPAITFNSHVFSSDPSRRYVTLNNQELVEGDFVNANVELVAIRMDDIVLRVAGNLCRLNALSDWG